MQGELTPQSTMYSTDVGTCQPLLHATAVNRSVQLCDGSSTTAGYYAFILISRCTQAGRPHWKPRISMPTQNRSISVDVSSISP